MSSASSHSSKRPASPSVTSISDSENKEFEKEEEEDSSFPKLKRSKVFVEKNEHAGSSNKERQGSESSIENIFQFNVPKEVEACIQNNQELSKKCHERLIREAVVCLEVTCSKTNEDGKITQDDFKCAAKKICQKVPMLKDKRPPGYPLKKPFPYWVSNKIKVMFKFQKEHFLEQSITEKYRVLAFMQS